MQEKALFRLNLILLETVEELRAVDSTSIQTI